MLSIQIVCQLSLVPFSLAWFDPESPAATGNLLGGCLNLGKTFVKSGLLNYLFLLGENWDMDRSGEN